MYQIETSDDGGLTVICRSLDDVSALLKDHPEIIEGDEFDLVEEGRKTLVQPELLGHFEYEDADFNQGTATLVFTHRQFGANNRLKQGWNRPMVLEAFLTKIGLDAVAAGLKAKREKVSEKKYKELISAAVAELLRLDPDITKAQSNLLAADALGLTPSPEMLKAKDTMSRVKHYSKKRMKKAVKKKAAKKKKKQEAV